MDNLTLSDILPELREKNDPSDFEKSPEWSTLLHLTYAVWRVIDATVESEFLKNKIKHTAAEILAEFPNAHEDAKKAGQLVERMRGVRALLSLAQKVSNSREINFLILKNEYRKVGSLLSQKATHERPVSLPTSAPAVSRRAEHSSNAPQEKPSVVERGNSGLTDRQQKILQLFQKRSGDNIKLKEVMQILPGLTDRTIRTDLRELCMKKFIVRSEGHGQASFYRLAKGK